MIVDVHTNLQVGYKFVVHHGAVVVEVLRVGRDVELLLPRNCLQAEKNCYVSAGPPEWVFFSYPAGQIS